MNYVKIHNLVKKKIVKMKTVYENFGIILKVQIPDLLSSKDLRCGKHIQREGSKKSPNREKDTAIQGLPIGLKISSCPRVTKTEDSQRCRSRETRLRCAVLFVPADRSTGSRQARRQSRMRLSQNGRAKHVTNTAILQLGGRRAFPDKSRRELITQAA